MSKKKFGTKGTRKRRNYSKRTERKNRVNSEIDTVAMIKNTSPSLLRAQITKLNTKHIEVITTKHGKGKSKNMHILHNLLGSHNFIFLQFQINNFQNTKEKLKQRRILARARWINSLRPNSTFLSDQKALIPSTCYLWKSCTMWTNIQLERRSPAER